MVRRKKSKGESTIDITPMFDCYLLGDPYGFNYRIKEQKKLISTEEFLSTFSFHLKFDNDFWYKFLEFAEKFFKTKLKFSDLITFGLEVPLYSRKKGPLIQYSIKNYDNTAVPTLRRQETMHKSLIYFSFVSEDFLPAKLGTQYRKFETLILSLVYAIPDEILDREWKFVNSLREHPPLEEFAVSFLSPELEKYNISRKDLRDQLRKNPLLPSVLQSMMDLWSCGELYELPKSPLYLIRDFYKLSPNNNLGSFVNTFLMECKHYLSWLTQILRIGDDEKRTFFIDLINNFSHYFYIWVSFPHDFTVDNYILKMEFMEPYVRIPEQDAPIGLNLANSGKRSELQQIKQSPKCLKSNRILKSVVTPLPARIIRRCLAPVISFGRKFAQATRNARRKSTSTFWSFPISRMGGTPAYHYEIYTSAPSLDIVEYGLYDSQKSKFYDTGHIFGTTQKTKQFLHMYTTQKQFYIDGKRSSILSDWHLWMLLTIDKLHILFYITVILAEMVLLFVKSRIISDWYFTLEGPNWTSDLTFIPLLTLAATLSLLYRTSLLAENVTRKWSFTILVGLIIYVVTTLANGLIIKFSLHPIWNIWSSRIAIMFFLWYIMDQFLFESFSQKFGFCKTKVLFHLLLYAGVIFFLFINIGHYF